MNGNPSGRITTSQLAQYTAQYGPQLRSLLPVGPGAGAAITATSSVLGTPPPNGGGSAQPQDGFDSALAANRQQALAADQSALEAEVPRAPARSALEGQQSTASDQDPQIAGGGQRGTSFRAMWDGLEKEEREARTQELEEALNKGKQTINSAYDELIKQMGTRPDGNLSKEEKAMAILEFGLALMKNSSAQAYGPDLGGAIGDAGLTAVQGMRQRRETRQKQYDDDIRGIEAARARDLSALGSDLARESVRSSALSTPRVQGTVTTADDSALLYDSAGNVQPVIDPRTAEPVKVRPPRESSALDRPSDFERRYAQYMRIHGVSADGQPLSGEALRRVQQAALEFAGDTRGQVMSDAEMISMAERSADDFMRAHADSFRDMTPDQIADYRRRVRDERLNDLRAGRVDPAAEPESALDRPGARGPQRRRPTKAAPAAAIAFLRENPGAVDPVTGKTRRELFRDKYGYLPAGL